MAHCPKCGTKLKITDISPYCPTCKVNMTFYGFTENFEREAKKAELSQAGINCKIRRLKYAFIGTRLTIARLCVMLLPVAAMLMPACTVTLTLPFRQSSPDIGLMGLISLFTGDDLPYILSMSGSSFDGAAFAALKGTLFSYLAVAAFAALAVVTSLLCFLSVKNMQKITAACAAGGIAASAVCYGLAHRFVTACAHSVLLRAGMGYGLFAVAAMFAVVFAVNVRLSIKGIAVEYDEGMLERAEIYKQVKAGRVKLDDLPQPVVQTAATRLIDEEIAKQELAILEKHAKKEEQTNG